MKDINETDLQKQNQANQAKYMKKRELEEQKAKQLVHELISKIDKEPKNYHHYYELATVLLEMKDYEQAEELLMKALGLFDTDLKVKDILTYGLGNVYYAAEDYDRAIQQFQLIKDQQLQTEAYIMLAQSYMAKGDNKRSLVFALTAQAALRTDFTVNQLLGDNLLALGDFKQAKEFYDIAIQADPNDGAVQFNRGLVAMVLGEKAQPYFQRAQELNPQYYNDGQSRLKDLEKLITPKD